MTRINDYIWQLPHNPLPDDPPDVAALQQSFNMPIAAALEQPLAALGYILKSSDVMVKLQDRVDRTFDTYLANVRFIRYLRSDVIARVHFEHGEWATILPGNVVHRYTINLDRFKIIDPSTQQVVPGWQGRLHTRVSSRDAYVLEHDGEDQIWAFSTAEQLERQLALFLDKFTRLGVPWLESPAGL